VVGGNYAHVYCFPFLWSRNNGIVVDFEGYFHNGRNILSLRHIRQW